MKIWHMTTWQLIRKMLQKGYQFETGRHFEGYRGYWAYFVLHEKIEIASVCIECNQSIVTDFDRWEDAGHALTPHRAVVMAAKIALNQPVTVPLKEEFEL